MAALITRWPPRADVILGVGTTETDLTFAYQLRRQRVKTPVIGLVATPIQLFEQTLGTEA